MFIKIELAFTAARTGGRVYAVARLAAEQAEAVYAAIIAQRQVGAHMTAAGEVRGFDPKRPSAPDWQRVLERIAANLQPSRTGNEQVERAIAVGEPARLILGDASAARLSRGRRLGSRLGTG